MGEAELLVRNEHNSVEASAISNVRGNWYEWILALGAREFNMLHMNSNCLLPLPNISSFDCSRLYVDRLHGYIQDLRSKVLSTSGVSLVTSNPDFVIIDRSLCDRFLVFSGSGNEESLLEIDRSYQNLVGKCELDKIIGFVSSKTSLRPDRRLQIAHEGSLMKALYRHLITRDWIIDASGICYYALTLSATDADRRALKTVATHSIADVGSKPQAAVDDLFCISSGYDLAEVLGRVLG